MLARSIVSCEPLEARRLLSAFPTPSEQYILELINRARANPDAEVTRLSAKTWGDDPSQVPGTAFPKPQTPSLNEGLAAGTIPDTPKPPLAFNADLTQAARDYSNTLLANGAALAQAGTPLTHTFNGTDPTSRDQAAGYNGVAGENLAVEANSAPLPIATAISETLHDNLFIDSNVPGRGHRTNLMNTTSGYREIGIGLASSTTYAGLGADVPNGVMLTEDFGVPQSSSAILTGVAFTDANHDNFFEPGEQLGGVTITAKRASDNAVFSTVTWDAGGYSLPLAPGTYNVTASGGPLSSPVAASVTIGAENVEQDFIAAAIGPVVTTQPLNQTVTTGAAVTFTAAASGSPTPTVQWQVSVKNGAFANIPGATNTTLSFTAQTADNGKRFQAVFTNPQGTAKTNAATLVLTVNGGAAGLTAALSGALPPKAVGGAKTTAAQTLRITNTGGRLISGQVTVTLFVSHNQTLDGSETQFATITPHVNLKVGATASVVVRLKNFPAVADGAYFILMQVKSGAASAVAASKTSVAIAKPFIDLSDGVAVSPASVTRGKKATLLVTVTNSGNVVAKRPLAMALSASTDSSGANAMSLGHPSGSINIKPDGKQVLRIPVLVPLALAPGNDFFIVTVDPADTFGETTLSNNTAVAAAVVV
jgi:uncharacterized protein YkwD